MASNDIIPEILSRLILEASEPEGARFPQTEIFNEGWMLRLVLEAFKRLNIQGHPLSFEKGADWFSEVRLSSRFRPRSRADGLGEGFTHADAVVGHFHFRADTTAGLWLPEGCKQFVVVEAKMFSNLSMGVKNALGFNQAARNVACMAEAIEQGGSTLNEIETVGFYVVAPQYELRAARRTNLEVATHPNAVRSAVSKRIEAYESESGADSSQLDAWRERAFDPLVTRMEEEGTLRVLTWDELIDIIRDVDRTSGEVLWRFYQRCLRLNQRPPPEPML
ncbi:hypothetical protein EF888_12860 [Silicimonas algicola]|uniref:Restriction endonuclease n=1 Tax=Silicimonas algicola TaxID=1826607 RepID=A0A316GC99_9RHOB|nr:hypothetical protein [Silicimonas algicola]AZQ67946.1 hypothetical protein EF888_12860 [Silicimonas algicola]PWK57616.1 hypothetical protein C8D95_102261 [Silicimonas algicola]